MEMLSTYHACMHRQKRACLLTHPLLNRIIVMAESQDCFIRSNYQKAKYSPNMHYYTNYILDVPPSRYQVVQSIFVICRKWSE